MQAPRASPPSAPTAPSPWPAPSPIVVFLRNIHLLHLDQQTDWPGLSRKLFTGGQKVQTQRVKSVEWVLYHLFLLWSPAEAKNKLRPFFPPLEALQSVNLRAALFRALSELKKNGDLGRETIVRKTMLDDCKGPKFEEVLAVFSTAVLRKVISENTAEAGTRLALARSISENEERRLVPLIIAHHAALSTAKRDNVRIRESHEQFVALLEEKAKELSARSNTKLKLAEESHSESLAHDVKANWLGSQNLVDALFHGGSSVEKDAFLELPFEKAWYHARKGNIDQLRRPSHVDLLQDMEAFSSRQRARLQRLKGAKKTFVGQRSRTNTMPSDNKDKCLTFRDHQTLTVAGTSKSLRGTVERRDLFAEHEAIIQSLRTSLSEVKGMQAQHAEHIATVVEPPRPPNEALSPIPDIESVPPSPSPSPSVQVTDYEEYRLPPSFDISSSPDFAIKHPDPPSTETTKQELEQIPFSHPSLLERTRQSMSLLPPAPARSRQSLASRRETRHSQYFPINQFDTPTKEVPETPSRSGASTPRDELFTEEAEYASIFKSRPRVAHSPLMSPAVHVGFDDEVEEGYVDSESVLDLASAGSPLGRKRR